MTFLKRIGILPRWLIAFLDLSVLFLSVPTAFILRFNFEWGELEKYSVLQSCLIFVCAGLISMVFTKSFVGIVRQTRARDGINIFKSILFAFLLSLLFNFCAGKFGNQSQLLPNSVLIIASLISLVILIVYRMMVKELFFYLKPSKKQVKNALIFGAGDAGLILHDMIKNDKSADYVNCGFLDDDTKKQGKLLDGLPIYGDFETLEILVKQKNITDLIISVQELPVERKREIVNRCLDLGLHVSTIPPADQWVNVGLEPDTIRDVNIEDLLGRDTINLDNINVQKNIKDKVILVSGAAGSIGSELCRQIIRYQPRLLILLDYAESALYDLQQDILACDLDAKIRVVLGDVRSKRKMMTVFETYKPQLVFQAAAYKHVPMIEKYPEEAVHCNVLGTRIMADLSVLNKVEKFVLVSTDKAVNPTSVMGASKRLAEMYVQSLNAYLRQDGKDNESTKFITTRFGNVLGSNGSVIPLFKKQIKKGGPVTVTDERITRYFMTIPEACDLVLEAGIMGNGGEIYVFDMGEPVRIVDLAKRMIQLSGKRIGKDIQIVFTGLREGEKLYEELLNNKEEVMFTHHPKIKIAKVDEVSYEKIENQIALFEQLLKNGTENDLVSHIKIIVKEFKSNASRFEILDRMN